LLLATPLDARASLHLILHLDHLLLRHVLLDISSQHLLHLSSLTLHLDWLLHHVPHDLGVLHVLALVQGVVLLHLLLLVVLKLVHLGL